MTTSTSSSTFAIDVARDLALSPRPLQSKYLYDRLGSRLFEAICRLPWYTITRAELGLLSRHAAEVAAELPDPLTLTELGPGDGEKIALLAAALVRDRSALATHLIDISQSALDQTERRLGRYEGVSVVGHRASYEEGLRRVARGRNGDGGLVVLFLGSNLGNSTAAASNSLRGDPRGTLQTRDAPLPGADLRQAGGGSPLLAYDDPSRGYRFQQERPPSTELGGNFDLSDSPTGRSSTPSNRATRCGRPAPAPEPRLRCGHSWSISKRGVHLDRELLQQRLRRGGFGRSSRTPVFARRRQCARREVQFALTLFFGADLRSREPMVAPGTRFGPYEILAPLGAGGMGEVYRARDTRLGREVALKILSEEFGRDPERVRRFEIEARSASALSDPHVVTVYDVGEQGPVHYIATELVEGSDLRKLLDAGPLRTAMALDIGVQIAEGLSAAHEKGIVHRDLKPENILLTKAGVAKIADFGLAKQTGVSSEVSQLVTATENFTGTGAMGTVAYISEQPADRSTCDPISFGLILYEMLAGRTASARQPRRHAFGDSPRRPARRSRRRGTFRSPLPACTAAYPGSREPVWIADSSMISRRCSWRWPDQSRPGPRRTGRASGGGARTRGGRSLPSALRRAKPSSANIDSLAILPFVNTGGKAEMEFLSDGITESLINKVAQVSGLKVISRSSAFHYKGREIDPGKVAKELNVKAVLTGHVLAVGDSLSVGAELVDAQDGRHLWGDQYNVKMADIFSMQSEIASQITTSLRGS